jgi:hypothetical protein
MNNQIPLWARAPFELIQHGQQHLDLGDDFDRRIAFISFDNAIESSITTYLELKPELRGGRIFSKDAVEKWLKFYPNKIEFFCEFAKNNIDVERFHRNSIHLHGLRNEIYHRGKTTVPSRADVEGIRNMAIKVFSTLFEVDAESELEALPQVAVPASPNGLSPQIIFLQNCVALEITLRQKVAHLKPKTTFTSRTLGNISRMWSEYEKHRNPKPPSDYTEIIRDARSLYKKIMNCQEDESVNKMKESDWTKLAAALGKIIEYVRRN